MHAPFDYVTRDSQKLQLSDIRGGIWKNLMADGYNGSVMTAALDFVWCVKILGLYLYRLYS